MVTTTSEVPPPSPARARYVPPSDIRVRCLVPALQTWSDFHEIPEHGLVEVEHVWMTFARWRSYSAKATSPWRSRRVFGFVVAHRLRP